MTVSNPRRPHQPLVSIIAPVCNTPLEYFSNCKRSVFQQKEQNFEWIIVDDGSNAETLQAIQNVAAEDSRVHLYQQNHQGVSAARNLGIKNSSGTFLTFLDADDALAPDFLATGLQIIQAANADITINQVLFIPLEKAESINLPTKPPSYKIFKELGLTNFIRFTIACCPVSLHTLAEYFAVNPTLVFSRIFRKEILRGVVFAEDMDADFTFSANVSLGNKRSLKGGANGISFFFHPNSLTELGSYGAGIGMSNVKGTFGFKLDTYYNDPADGKERNASPDQPRYRGKSYRAFVCNQGVNPAGEKSGNFANGFSQTILSNPIPQEIPQPVKNRKRPFTITYHGKTKLMTVTYGNQKWKRNIKSWVGSEAYSFTIASSTSAKFHNLQQVQIKQLTFTPTRH